MYVDGQTFTKMNHAAKEGNFGLAKAKVVSIEHLILLKISTLKVFQDTDSAKTIRT